jgi:hypothetical protein
MKVGFHSYQLGDRGTEICLYKYAKYNREILGNQSVIISTSSRPTPSLSRFNEFQVELYPDVWVNDGKNDALRGTLEKLVERHKIDVFYAIKGGESDGIMPKNCWSVAHCIFRMDQPHADVYAGVCEYISHKHGGIHPWVYHIVEAPLVEEDYRAELNIPRNALVLGRHGGNNTFNISFVPETIKKVINERCDLYFLFLNTDRFIDHPRVIHLPHTIDERVKTKFVNSCDAMIHARLDGEIFSLSVAEFSIQNKAIITWDGHNDQYDRGHVFTLGSKAIYYRGPADLRLILLYLDRMALRRADWDAFGDTYSPQKIMRQFNDKLLLSHRK